MTEYSYKVIREYPDGSQSKRSKAITRVKPLVVGGLYAHLGKGYPGMQRIISEEVSEIED